MTQPILPCELALAAIKADAGVTALVGTRISHKWGFERVSEGGAYDLLSGDLLPSVTVRQANDPPAETYGLYPRMIEVAVGSTSVDGADHLAVQYAASRIRTLLSGSGPEGSNPLFQSADYAIFTEADPVRPFLQLQFRYLGGGPLDIRLADIQEYTTMLFGTGTST